MKQAFGYIRVSDKKQLRGVSLREQKDAIFHYAQRNGFEIVKWFEEQQTAARQGRPEFLAMVEQLKIGKAKSIIAHKMDRTARNYHDMALIDDLIRNKGITVYSANEGLDLTTRSGRLAADLQWAIAINYTRNLGDETKKGLYGRLKEGIYPFQAPLGYLDTGAGNPKAIDPIKGPIIKEMFEMYATGKYSYEFLLEYASTRGLTSTKGKRLGLNGLSTIFQNPFYMGLILVKGQTFEGKHKPLISPALFNRVQKARKARTTTAHDNKYTHLFSRSVTCETCGFSLIAERQKGHVYYRCHKHTCSGTSFREEVIEEKLLNTMSAILLPEDIVRSLYDINTNARADEQVRYQEMIRSLQLQIENTEQRLSRLTDALIDGVVDKNTFDTRNRQLLTDKESLKHQLEQMQKNRYALTDLVKFYLERLECLKTTYLAGIREEKVEIAKALTSNFKALGKSLTVSLKSPFSDLALGFSFDVVPQRMSSVEPPAEDEQRISSSNNSKQIQELYDILVKAAQQNLENPLSDSAN